MSMMKRPGPVLMAAVMLVVMLGAGSASAANWDPANTTLAAHGTLTLDLSPSGVTMTCTFHSGVRSAGGADAFTAETGGTTPAPPTFSNCTSSVLGAVAVVVDAPWTFTATSTTAVDLTNGNFTMTSSAFGDCKIAASGVSFAWTWNNATHMITPGATSFPISESGAFCLGDTTMRITGVVNIPGVSIT